MTVTKTANKVIFTGTATTDVYNYGATFDIFAATDIVVTELLISSGVETVLTLDAVTGGYTVDLDVNGNFDGNITLSDGNLPTTKKLVIQSVLPFTQATDYTQYGPLPAETHEQGLDRLVKICQQLQEQIDRSIKVSVSTETAATSDSLIAQINAAVVAAQLAETNAETAETNAETAETNAETAQTAAEVAQAAAEAAQAALDLPTLVSGDQTRLLTVKATFDGYQLLTRDTLREEIGTPAGAYIPYGASTAPTGWLLCDGSAVSRTTYADLFAAISTSYGVGDGSTTFNVPDARGRMMIGLDNLGGSSANRNTAAAADSIGGSGGAESYDLSHTHSLSVTGTTSSLSGSLIRIDDNSGGSDYDWHNPTSHNHTVTSTGTSGSAGSATQSVLNPYLAGGVIIKT